jgi:hypothetical protein
VMTNTPFDWTLLAAHPYCRQFAFLHHLADGHAIFDMF